jgi:hypothetical protein
VIINYLSQLWELYQYRYPGLLPLLLLVLFLVILLVGHKLLGML